MQPNKRALLICAFSLSLTACSATPKLYPNAHLIAVGKGQSEKDVNECLELADQYTDNSAAYREAAINTAKGTVAGTAAGAVGGAIAHEAGRGTAIGAATGAVGALVIELFKLGETDPSYKSFTEYCLSKKGYEVVGW